MIASLLIAAGLATAAPTLTGDAPLTEAQHAMKAGRLDQARLLIARAIAQGAAQPKVDRALADFAFATGNNAEALARYEHVLQSQPVAELCERAAIAALRLGQALPAERHVECATKGDRRSWRAWNAKGTLLDHYGDWSGADQAYGRAAELSPERAEIWNNQGWSHLLRGDWQAALGYLQKAAQLDRKSLRIANNLELAKVALDAALPERRAGEKAEDWAYRLNDAGMTAQLMGNKQKAIAAFTRALDASEIWYARAANNLSNATAAK